MRYAGILVVLIAVLAISGFGQASGDSEAAIRRVLSEQQAAWNRQDLEGFMAGYWNSPELTFFSGAHESKGWQAALDRYRNAYQGAGHAMGRLEFANLRVEMLGPEAAPATSVTTPPATLTPLNLVAGATSSPDARSSFTAPYCSEATMTSPVNEILIDGSNDAGFASAAGSTTELCHAALRCDNITKTKSLFVCIVCCC